MAPATKPDRPTLLRMTCHWCFKPDVAIQAFQDGLRIAKHEPPYGDMSYIVNTSYAYCSESLAKVDPPQGWKP